MEEQSKASQAKALQLISQAVEEKWTELDLSGMNLTELPAEIGRLTWLETLILGKLDEKKMAVVSNPLAVLPESIAHLTNLQTLDLSFTQLSELPEGIAHLTNLQTLNLSGMQLSELPEGIARLTNLQSLDLSSCRILQLPFWFQSWNSPPKIDLRNNPLPVPEALLGPKKPWEDPGDFQAILSFYFQTQNPEAKPLFEAKLLIVGEGEVGKTTLAKKLEDSDYQLKPQGSNDPEESTEGIDIIQWQFDQSSGFPFRVNIWDFGGQEIYHATHQFFLTNRSLYVLVSDNRRESPNFYYWLNVIRLLSDNSPVLIVENEKKNDRCEINVGQLRAEFDNLINQTIRVNLADNRGLDDLKKLIQQHITVLPEVQYPWPYEWLKVRYALENYRVSYIPQTEYFALCKTNGIPDKTLALHVSGLLHDLGICLHFQKDAALKHYVILDPTWVTNAVYKVTSALNVQSNRGCFCRDDLDQIWSDRQYADMREELLQLMQKFFICYPLRSRPDVYIVPSLLSVDRPAYDWDRNQNLILRYEYEFMPKGMLTRLIVEMHEFIEERDEGIGLVWKTGVVLSHNNARAEIIENYDKREVSIRAVGNQCRTLLDWIRREMYKIHSSYPKLKYSERIPCTCSQCKDSQTPHCYLLSDLERRLANYVYEVQCEKSYETVQVQKLISNVTAPLSKNDISDRAEIPQFDKNQSISLQNHIYLEAPKNMTEIKNEFKGPVSGIVGSSFSDDAKASDNEFIQTNQSSSNLAEAAQEIQDLLDQLSKTYPTETFTQKAQFVEKAITQVESNPPLKRILSALDAGTMGAVAQLLNHPAAAFFIEAVKDWNQSKP